MTKPPRPRIRSFRDLDAWQTAILLVVEVYSMSRAFPSDERFGLTAQVRRAAVSVASSIAEGHARATRVDYRRFVSIARGSSAEIETQLEIAKRLGYVAARDLALANEHADHVGRMLTNLHRRLGTPATEAGFED